MQKKKFVLTMLDDEQILSEQTFEEILEEIFSSLDKDADFEKSYHPSDPFEPPEGASLEVEADASVTIAKLKEIYDISDEMFEILEDAICNYDCYDCWEKFCQDLKEEVESGYASYSIESYNASLRLNKDKTAIVLDFEVTDYSFDEHEYMESFRPEPDPYDWD